MKTLLITLITVMSVISLQAQHNRDYRFNDRNRYNYRNDNRGHDHYLNYNHRTNYQSRYLPIRARKDLRKLERRLAHRKECAWEDGHISRREARRIRDVERDIAELLYQYRGRNYTSRRSNRYCR